MRSLIKLSTGIVLVAAVAIAAPVSAESAIVTHSGDLCGVAGADADGNLVIEKGTLAQLVQNDNQVIMRCEGRGITNDSGRAQHFSGFRCGVPLPGSGQPVLADDTHATVSKSGTATLTCKLTLED